MKNLMKSASCGNPAKFVWQESVQRKPDLPQQSKEKNEKLSPEERARQVRDKLATSFKNITSEGLDYSKVEDTHYRRFFKNILKVSKSPGGAIARFKSGTKEIALTYYPKPDVPPKERHKGIRQNDIVRLKVDEDFNLYNLSFSALADGSGNQITIYIPNEGEKMEDTKIIINGEQVKLSSENMQKLFDKIDKYTEEMMDKYQRFTAEKAKRLRLQNEAEHRRKEEEDKKEAERIADF